MLSGQETLTLSVGEKSSEPIELSGNECDTEGASSETCRLDVLAGDGYLGDRINQILKGTQKNNNSIFGATRFAQAGIQSIRFQSKLEKAGGGSGGQGNDYAATVEITRNDGESVTLKGRISWQDQEKNTSMGVHIVETISSNNEFEKLFPGFGFAADRLNMIIPLKERNVESLLDKKDKTMVKGSANPPDLKVLCDFKPHPPTPSISLVNVDEVIPLAVCEVSEYFDNDATNEATYSFRVKLADGGTKTKQAFEYTFRPERKNQGYEVLEATVSSGGSTEELKKNELTGEIKVGKGVEEFVVAVRVRAEKELRKSDSLRLAVIAKIWRAPVKKMPKRLRDEDLQICSPDDGVGVTPMVRSVTGSVEVPMRRQRRTTHSLWN